MPTRSQPSQVVQQVEESKSEDEEVEVLSDASGLDVPFFDEPEEIVRETVQKVIV